MYKALEIKEEDGLFNSHITQKEFPLLENEEVLIKVKYSSLNYKDCLSISGNKGVTRQYPHIPGIDAAGIVFQSNSKNYQKGDEVIVTGYDLGMNVDGGFAQYVKVPSDWIVRLPKNLSLRQAMLFGTAGFTAALAVDNLKAHFSSLGNKRVLITGASGGVGSIAALLLKREGAIIIAASRDEKNSFFNNFDNIETVNTHGFLENNAKPLLSKEYDGVIDNLGGVALENIIKQLDYHGMVCSCGNVAGVNFQSTVFPFILRGVTVKGVTSANTEMSVREKIWCDIAEFRGWNALEEIVLEITLEEVVDKAELMLSGRHKGRFLVKLS